MTTNNTHQPYPQHKLDELRELLARQIPLSQAIQLEILGYQRDTLLGHAEDIIN